VAPAFPAFTIFDASYDPEADSTAVNYSAHAFQFYPGVWARLYFTSGPVLAGEALLADHGGLVIIIQAVDPDDFFFVQLEMLRSGEYTLVSNSFAVRIV